MGKMNALFIVVDRVGWCSGDAVGLYPGGSYALRISAELPDNLTEV
jgi:hypothetical protein